jgi:hypothetical protein
MTEEDIRARLPITDHWQANLHLEGYGFVNGMVLNFFECGGLQRAFS